MEKKKKVKKIDLKEFSKYERFYDREELMLFNYYMLKQPEDEEREIGIMSNLYSGCKIPYQGHIFHSSEQLLFYLNIVNWADKVGFSKEEIDSRLNFLLNTKDGFIVKNHPNSKYFFENIEGRKKRLLGKDRFFWEDCKAMYFVAKMKFIYTPELRVLMKKYEHLVWAENSFWNDTFSGLVFDKSINKYRGINVLGRCYKYLWKNKNSILGVS